MKWVKKKLNFQRYGQLLFFSLETLIIIEIATPKQRKKKTNDRCNYDSLDVGIKLLIKKWFLFTQITLDLAEKLNCQKWSRAVWLWLRKNHWNHTILQGKMGKRKIKK